MKSNALFEKVHRDVSSISSKMLLTSAMVLTLVNFANAQDVAPNEAPFVDPEIETVKPIQETQAPNAKVEVNAPKAQAQNSPKIQKTENAESGPRVKYIHHPMAAKGLVRINADGSYIYKTETKVVRSQSSTLRFGSIQPPDITGPTYTNGKHDTFDSMYTENNISNVQYDYEWQPFSKFGKLGVQLGLGFFTSTGKGHFKDGTVARESYNFYSFPLSVGGIYRMEFMRRQWLAPYISGGLSYFPTVEMRDDGKTPTAVGAAAGYFAGGAMINISSWDREVAYQLESEYEISNLWLSIEFKAIKGFRQDLDVTANCLSVGIAVDY